MAERPDEYESLQLSWSRCRSADIRNGAMGRVHRALRDVKQHALPADHVLVIGPQHGFELEAFRAAGVKRLLGVDAVPEFVDDCTKLGFAAIQCDAERLTVMVEGRWNIYTCHSLEHCWDFPAAAEQIVEVVDRWLHVCVPVEKGEVKDKAHLSPVRDHETFLAAFKGLRVVWQGSMDPNKQKQNLTALLEKR